MSEKYDLIFEMGVSIPKSCFLFIIFINLYLVKAIIKI